MILLGLLVLWCCCCAAYSTEPSCEGSHHPCLVIAVNSLLWSATFWPPQALLASTGSGRLPALSTRQFLCQGWEDSTLTSSYVLVDSRSGTCTRAHAYATRKSREAPFLSNSAFLALGLNCGCSILHKPMLALCLRSFPRQRLRNARLGDTHARQCRMHIITKNFLIHSRPSAGVMKLMTSSGEHMKAREGFGAQGDTAPKECLGSFEDRRPRPGMNLRLTFADVAPA